MDDLLDLDVGNFVLNDQRGVLKGARRRMLDIYVCSSDQHEMV